VTKEAKDSKCNAVTMEGGTALHVVTTEDGMALGVVTTEDGVALGSIILPKLRPWW